MEIQDVGAYSKLNCYLRFIYLLGGGARWLIYLC